MRTKSIYSLFIALFLLLTTAGRASAIQWLLSNQKPTKEAALQFKAGESDSLCLSLIGMGADISALQLDIELPKSATLMADPFLNSKINNGHTLTLKSLASTETTQMLRLVIYSASNSALTATSEPLIYIPVYWSYDAKKATVKTANSMMTTTALGTSDIDELGETTLTALVEKKQIIVSVSGLEQVANKEENASVNITTIPADAADILKVDYSSETRTAIGNYQVTISLPDAYKNDYQFDTQIFTMVLTNKKKVTISPALTASPIKQGEPLSASSLTGGEATEKSTPVSGTFQWVNPDLIVSGSGDLSFPVRFYPDNAAYYATQEQTVTVTVTPTYKVTALASANGSVQIVGGRADNTYVDNQTLTLTATPDANCKFMGWSDGDNNATRTVEVRANANYIANFEPIMHTVTVDEATNGTISLSDATGTIISGSSRQKGTVVQVAATPNKNYEVERITVGGQAIIGDKFVLSEATTVSATFKEMPDAPKNLTTDVTGGGSILFYKGETLLLPGATVTIGDKLTVIALPNSGNTLNGDITVTGATKGTDGLYTVTGDVEATASFQAQTFTVFPSYVDAKNEAVAGAEITLDKTTAKYDEGVRIKDVTTPENYRLSHLMVNGKKMYVGDSFKVKSDVQVVGVFEPIEDILPDYVLWTKKTLNYTGLGRSLYPVVSSRYRDLGFNVTYRQNGADVVGLPKEAGTYDVVISRGKDGRYGSFTKTIKEGLVINPVPVTVTEGPTTNRAYPLTRPDDATWSVNTLESNSDVKIFTLTPPADNGNYTSSTFYWAPDNIDKISFDFGTLTKATATVGGSVRVTNGGMSIDANTDGTISIPKGFFVTLEAVPAEDYHFVEWSDGIKTISRPFEVSDIEAPKPIFAEKNSLENVTLTSTSSPYTGTMPTLSVNSELEGFLLSVYSNKGRTIPADMKDAGTYYVQITRQADADYVAYTKVVRYEITKADVPEADRKAPTASALLAGQKLRESALEGGSAGIVAGSFAWVAPETVVSQQNKTAKAKFTPTDANYNEFVIDVTIEVKGGTKSTEVIDPQPSEPEPSDPQPSEPDDTEKPELPEVKTPVVTERTPTTAIISWEKVDGAKSYSLYLYASRTSTTYLKRYDFDEKGNLKSTAIQFKLEDLTEGQSYYIETYAYNALGVQIAKQTLELSGTPTAIEAIAECVTVRGGKGQIVIEPTTAVEVQVITVTGRLLYAGDITDLTRIPAPAGIHLVLLRQADQQAVTKVSVR